MFNVIFKGERHSTTHLNYKCSNRNLCSVPANECIAVNVSDYYEQMINTIVNMSYKLVTYLDSMTSAYVGL